MTQPGKIDRPIVADDSLLIDPNLLDNSNGTRMLQWIQMRKNLPKQRKPFFDLEEIEKDTRRLSLRINKISTNRNEISDVANDQPESSEHASKEDSNSPSNKSSDSIKENANANTSINKSNEVRNTKRINFYNLESDDGPQRKSPKRFPKSPNLSTNSKIPVSPARNALTRKSLLAQLNAEHFNGVVSTPFEGHRVVLNASASPIDKQQEFEGIQRLQIRKPQEINKIVDKRYTNQVQILEQIVINPVSNRQSNVVQTEDQSPLGIINARQTVKPKSLSAIIAAHSENMIPTRNENFDASSNDSVILTSIEEQPSEENEMEHEIIPETQASNRSDRMSEHEQIPETQASNRSNKTFKRHRSSSSQSSTPGSEILIHFNESIVPNVNVASPAAASPLLKTVLRSFRPTQEETDFVRPKRKVKGKKKKQSTNDAAKTYLDLNNSLVLTSLRETMSSQGNKSKRKLYSQRFDESPKAPTPEKQTHQNTGLNVDDDEVLPTSQPILQKISSRRVVSKDNGLSSNVRQKNPTIPQSSEDEGIQTEGETQFTAVRGKKRTTRTTRNTGKTSSKTTVSRDNSNEPEVSKNNQKQKLNSVSKTNRQKTSEQQEKPLAKKPNHQDRAKKIQSSTEDVESRPRQRTRVIAADYIHPDTEIQTGTSSSNVVNVHVDANRAKTQRVLKNKLNCGRPIEVVESAHIVNGVRKSTRTRFLPTNGRRNTKVIATESILDEIYKDYQRVPAGFNKPRKATSKKKTERPAPVKVSSKSSETETISSIDEREIPSDPLPKNGNQKKRRRPPKSSNTDQPIINEDTEIQPESNNAAENTHQLPNTEELGLVGTSNGTFKVPKPISKPKQSARSKEESKQQDSLDSGLQSEENNTHTSPLPQPPPVQGDNFDNHSLLSSNSSQSSARFDWITRLMDQSVRNPDKRPPPFYEADFNELVHSEDVIYLEADGVAYASYTSEHFKHCGYIRLEPHVTKKKCRAKHYNLRYLFLGGPECEIILDGKPLNPKAGSLFYVKKGHTYSITNKGDSRGIFYFTKHF